MPLVPSSRLVPWDDFVKQLEPEEIEWYSHARFFAKETGEPQEVILEGITIGIIWPSGMFQPAFRFPDDQEPSMNQFLDGAKP